MDHNMLIDSPLQLNELINKTVSLPLRLWLKIAWKKCLCQSKLGLRQDWPGAPESPGHQKVGLKTVAPQQEGARLIDQASGWSLGARGEASWAPPHGVVGAVVT